MFCALTLCEFGYRPVVLERGADMDSRIRAVEGFWAGGALDSSTNVQFGEGGAGTFSDGKLTTRIGDPLCSRVLERLVEFGAPEDILTQAKPHIGTDKLRRVVKNLRSRVLELGGEVRFLSPLETWSCIRAEWTAYASTARISPAECWLWRWGIRRTIRSECCTERA